MVFSHGFLHPDLGSVSQDDESQQSLLQSPHFSPGLQVAASWSTTAIECTGDFFLGGFGRWVFLLDIGIEWNLFQRHFCWKIQEWHPFFSLNIIEKWVCWEVCFFLGQGVTMTLFFNEVRTSSLLLPSSTYVNHKLRKIFHFGSHAWNFHWSGNFIVHSIKLR